MIEVRNLVKKYGEHLAVDNLSFTVEKGQVVGFLGPNGAGKSTTMNMLTGYISATEGSITINGIDMFDEPEEAKKSIGYLPELPPVYPDMTVKEYLSFVAELKKVDKKRRAIMLRDIMQKTGVADVSGRLIKHLSKGYRQRLGLAQAIVGYPELLILDEPTVGLDPAQIIEIRDLIKELAQSHTIILSSHILSEVSAVCDTIMIINKGRLIVSDKPETIAKRLGGASGIRMKVLGEKEQVNAALQAVATVRQLTYRRSDEDGLLAFTVYGEEGVDIRAAVSTALVGASCIIYEMTASDMTLEDMFLELTKEGTDSTDAAELDAETDAGQELSGVEAAGGQEFPGEETDAAQELSGVEAGAESDAGQGFSDAESDAAQASSVTETDSTESIKGEEA